MQKSIENIATKTALPWATIIAVIQAALAALAPILANCGQTPTPKAIFAQAGHPRARRALNEGMLANDIWPLTKQGRELRQAIIEEGKTITDDAAIELMAEVGPVETTS